MLKLNLIMMETKNSLIDRGEVSNRRGDSLTSVKVYAQSVVAVEEALERCRRHLKHFAETVLLLDNLQALLGGASDPNGDVVRNLLKQTGRSSAAASGAPRPNTL